jgi:hypothetical protein
MEAAYYFARAVAITPRLASPAAPPNEANPPLKTLAKMHGLDVRLPDPPAGKNALSQDWRRLQNDGNGGNLWKICLAATIKLA